MDFKNAFDSIVPDLREKIGLRCPQLKMVYPEMDIEDVRNFGHNFCWEGDGIKVEKIGGRNYVVAEDSYEQLKEMLELPECKRLMVPLSLQDEIHKLYMKVVKSRSLFEKAMNDEEFRCFRNVYEKHLGDEKVFQRMEQKYSIVTTFLFSLYHYNMLKK